MFFVLSKVAGFLALPSNALIVLGGVGAGLATFGLRGLGCGVMTASLAGLAIAGLSPLANVLLSPLEERFPRAALEGPAPIGIVVLGGSFDTVVAGARHEMALTEAAERLTEIAALARRWPEARILFSGGSGSLVFDGATEAELARRIFESFGIEPSRVELEDASRNTVENARLSREIAKPREGERWLLVTSAYHMPRAVGCFRGAGFPVEAWPVDYRTRGPEDAARPFASVSAGLRRTDVAVREWVGLVTYWALGYVSAPFPKP
jgi:uncharacterized SAM-binding protein YcdF (DUF218 family)